MGRLIDADELDIYDVSPAYGMCVMGVTQEDIDDAPTVEAKPVRHGHWVRKGLLFHCSACGYGAFNSYFVYGARYCPICGAKMDERKEE